MFTFTASGSAATGGYEYRITWGDGSPVQVISRTPNNGTVTATHAYSFFCQN